MAAPTSHSEVVQNASPGTTGTSSAVTVSPGDLLTVILVNDNDTQPTFTVKNADGSHSLITEDETISASTAGVALYGDGSSTNHTGCVTTNGSATVSDASALASDVGKMVTGSGIPARSYITSVNISNHTFQLNQNATASATVTLALATIGPDEVVTLSGAKAYLYSIRIDPSSTSTSFEIVYAFTTNTRARYELRSSSPPSGSLWPVRASRIMAHANQSAGWTSGGGDQSLTLTGTIDARPCMLVAVVNQGATTSTTVTEDANNDGTFELSDIFSGASGAHGFYGYYDTSAGPTLAQKIHSNANWGTPNGWAAVVYAAADPIITTSIATETDSAFSTTHARHLTTAIAPETDTAGQVTGSGHTGTAAETDTAFAVTHARHLTTTIATETDSAFPATHGHTIAGPGLETDIAFAIGTTWFIATAELTLGALAPGQVPITLFVWALKAFAVDAGDIRVAIKDGPTTFAATSAWMPLTNSIAPYTVAISGPVSNPTDLRVWWQTRRDLTDTLAPEIVDIELSVSLGTSTASETDTAFGATSAHHLGPGLETDTAFAVAHHPHVTTAIAAETDIAFSVAPRIPHGTTTIATEVDTAGFVTIFEPSVAPVGITIASDDLLDLVIPVRADRFEFHLLDATHHKIGVLDVSQQTPPQVTVDTTRNATRSLTNVTIVGADLSQIDPLTDRVQPVLILQNGANYPLGVFMFGQDNTSPYTWGQTKTPELVDETFLINRQLDATASLATGGSIIGLIAQLLAPIAIPEVAIEVGDQAAASPLVYRVGSGRYAALAALASLLGCFPPYFDNHGVLRFKAAPQPADTNLDHVYEAGGRIIDGTLIRSSTAYLAPNRYVVIGDNPTTPTVGIYDLPASAPHSAAQNGGNIVTTSRNMQGLADQATADLAAYIDALTDRSTYGTITFSSTADPRHDTFDTLGVLGDRYLETGWALTCSPGGAMTHQGTALWH